jgi:hypothetical protein
LIAGSIGLEGFIMAAASAEGEQNPWPAFVDVLTAVIMVVTFLLVIMCAAVMSLSQKIVHDVRSSVSGEAMARAAEEIQILQEQLRAVEGIIAASGGDPRAALRAIELSQVQRVEGDLRRATLSRQIDEENRFIVESPVDETETGGSVVESADVLFTLEFEPDAVRVGQATEEQAMAVVQRANIPAGTTIEIWSIAPADTSVSDMQRIAYYRALVARNILIRAGVAASNITAQVRVTQGNEEAHAVRVIVKP